MPRSWRPRACRPATRWVRPETGRHPLAPRAPTPTPTRPFAMVRLVALRRGHTASDGTCLQHVHARVAPPPLVHTARALTPSGTKLCRLVRVTRPQTSIEGARWRRPEGSSGECTLREGACGVRRGHRHAVAEDPSGVADTLQMQPPPPHHRPRRLHRRPAVIRFLVGAGVHMRLRMPHACRGRPATVCIAPRGWSSAQCNAAA